MGQACVVCANPLGQAHLFMFPRRAAERQEYQGVPSLFQYWHQWGGYLCWKVSAFSWVFYAQVYHLMHQSFTVFSYQFLAIRDLLQIMCNWDFHQVLICFWMGVNDKEHNALYLMIVFASECCTSKAAYMCVCTGLAILLYKIASIQRVLQPWALIMELWKNCNRTQVT